MDFLRARRKFIKLAGDPVVEAGTDAHHDIAIVHRQVGLVGAVHAQHAEELWVGSRIRAQPHQRQRARITRQAHELGQQLRCRGAGIDDAAAAIEDRLLGLGQQFHRLLDRLQIALDLGIVTFELDFVRQRIDAGGLHHVLGQVDHHRAGAAASGDVEGLVHRASQVVDGLDQVVVLGTRTGDAGGVGLLEGVVADQVRRHLAGQANDGNGIHQRVGEPRYRVGGAGTGRHQHHADLAGGARVALGRVHGAGLLADQDVAERVLIENGVIDRQYGAARITEDLRHALIDQAFQEDFRTVHLLVCHRPCPLDFNSAFVFYYRPSSGEWTGRQPNGLRTPGQQRIGTFRKFSAKNLSNYCV